MNQRELAEELGVSLGKTNYSNKGYRPLLSAVARLERALATGKHSPSVATLRKYVRACGKELQLQVS